MLTRERILQEKGSLIVGGSRLISRERTSSATHYAAYLDLRAQACRLCAEMKASNVILPKRLVMFAGLPRRINDVNKGPRPRVLEAITKALAARDNKPMTYKALSEATGIKVSQVRSCCSRNQTEQFERAGTEHVGDKAYAVIRLSKRGVEYAATI